MKKYTACLLLTLTVLFVFSCGKKAEAPPKEELKTKSVERQAAADETMEQAPAPPTASTGKSMSRGFTDNNVSVADAENILKEPVKPGQDMQQGGLANLAGYLRADTSAPADKKFIRTGDIKFKVANVHKATEKIEDLTAKYSGFVVNSDLKNEEGRTTENRYAKDTLVLVKEITVKGEIKLRVPAEKLDSLVRELNEILVFLDYRILRREDVTLRYAALQKQKERLQSFERRQKHNIDTRGGNLENRTYAEEELLNKQMQQDDKELQKLELDDQVKYATITLWIYQPPVVISEKIYDFNYIEDLQPGFWERLWDSITKGWTGVGNVIVGLITIWPIIILVIIGIFVYRALNRRGRK